MFVGDLFIIAKAGKPQVSINQWIDKQSVVCPYNGLLLSNKKVQTTHIITKSQVHYTNVVDIHILKNSYVTFKNKSIGVKIPF